MASTHKIEYEYISYTDLSLNPTMLRAIIMHYDNVRIGNSTTPDAVSIICVP
jgi:hypothetical protein